MLHHRIVIDLQNNTFLSHCFDKIPTSCAEAIFSLPCRFFFQLFWQVQRWGWKHSGFDVPSYRLETKNVSLKRTENFSGGDMWDWQFSDVFSLIALNTRVPQHIWPMFIFLVPTLLQRHQRSVWRVCQATWVEHREDQNLCICFLAGVDRNETINEVNIEKHFFRSELFFDALWNALWSCGRIDCAFSITVYGLWATSFQTDVCHQNDFLTGPNKLDIFGSSLQQWDCEWSWRIRAGARKFVSWRACAQTGPVGIVVAGGWSCSHGPLPSSVPSGACHCIDGGSCGEVTRPKIKNIYKL